MAHHLVLGAGGIGRATTARLVALGETVTLASRTGRVSDRPWDASHAGAVTVVSADARDADRLTELASGAASIVNAINPPSYTTWDADWPPVAAALLAAAESSGAGLVTVSNLYGYGVVDEPMREDRTLRPNGHKGELRARMWRDALALHGQGRIRATELRASDYFGPSATAGASVLNDFVLEKAARGGTVVMPMGRVDTPHSWTYLPDIGVLAAALATDDRSWGHAWHVPTSAPRSVRDVAGEAARLRGHEPGRVWTIPRSLVTAAGSVVPLLKELRETRHQFERPFVLDSTLTERTFGLTPTPWEDALKATLTALAS
jgi:nucleoside-diphosphate-sugar epimerase